MVSGAWKLVLMLLKGCVLLQDLQERIYRKGFTGKGCVLLQDAGLAGKGRARYRPTRCSGGSGAVWIENQAL